jgi:hypothetical protein
MLQVGTRESGTRNTRQETYDERAQVTVLCSPAPVSDYAIWRKLPMELDRNRAMSSLKMMILVRQNDKKRLQAIIAFSQSPERRAKATCDLADTLEEIAVAVDELARIEAEIIGQN